MSKLQEHFFKNKNQHNIGIQTGTRNFFVGLSLLPPFQTCNFGHWISIQYLPICSIKIPYIFPVKLNLVIQLGSCHKFWSALVIHHYTHVALHSILCFCSSTEEMERGGGLKEYLRFFSSFLKST